MTKEQDMELYNTSLIEKEHDLITEFLNSLNFPRLHNQTFRRIAMILAQQSKQLADLYSAED